MSYSIEILGTTNIVEIETNIEDIIDNIEIVKYTENIIEINNNVGTVFASDIVGLETFIGNVIDSYSIECGTPLP